MLKLLKIPIGFFITGICWAVFSDPIITFLTQHLDPEHQDLYRSLNDFAFVLMTAFILYFEIRKQEYRLLRSEEDYRRLFESNPNPMWIYTRDNMKFVRVNRAAIEKYGYTKKQFLKMSLYDIRPQEDKERLKNYIKNIIDKDADQTGVWQHITSTGELLKVRISSNNIIFNNKDCRLALVSDITELTAKEDKLQDAYQKIKNQNEALLQLAWSNSHEIRRPLCSVLGLINLLKESTNEQEREEYIKLMEQCSTEIDTLLKKNNSDVDKTEPEIV